MMLVVMNQGKVRFHLFEGAMNADVLIVFMRRLVKDTLRKVILILDDLRVDHVKVVKDCLEEHAQQVEVFYLPTYYPVLHSDENLNCNLKAGVHSDKPARRKVCLVTRQCDICEFRIAALQESRNISNTNKFAMQHERYCLMLV